MCTYRITPKGSLAPAAPAASLAESSLSLPPGVYTTFRTYGGSRVVRFADHLERLRLSARLLDERIVLDEALVRAALRQLLADRCWPETRVRLTATFDAPERSGEMFLAAEPLAPPDPALYADGVAAATVPHMRSEPRAKSTAFIGVAAALYARKPAGVYELLMVGDDGALLEGLTSNFFGVQGGVIRTAREGVLEGVTRTLVLEVAAHLGRPVALEPVSLGAIAELDEAFITSSSREVVAVVSVDAVRIGAGRPGPVVAALLAGYRERVSREAQEI